MPSLRHRAILERTLLVITDLFMLGGFIALGLSKAISQENRALIITVSSIGVIGGLFGLMLVAGLRRLLRRWIWLRVMDVWRESSRHGNTPNYDMSDNLSEDELRALGIQIYSRIGYRIPNCEGKDYLQLINPDGKIELLACKRQVSPIPLYHVYSLELEMKRTKAVQGFFWSPSGFSSESIDWAQHRNIILADKGEIGRLIQCARAKGSRLLEYK